MITISNRIEEIKKKLDELENHVNTTLSVLDCKSLPLEKYPEDYKNFEWSRNTFDYCGSRYNYVPIYSEEICKNKLKEFKEAFDKIHESNMVIIEQNKKTLNKIVEFFCTLGLSKQSLCWTGTGKKRSSFYADSDWVNSLKRQYPTRDENYEIFQKWHNETMQKITKTFEEIRSKELMKAREIAIRQAEIERQAKEKESLDKMIDFAIDFLKENGKTDFTRENAIEYANRVRQEIKDKKNKEPEIIDVPRRNVDAIKSLEV